MSDSSAEATAPSRAARLAGAMYILQMATAVFAESYLRGSLVVRGDPVRTAQNILHAERLFRIGIASDLITYVAVLIATWCLFVLLRPVDRHLAALAVFFRLIELSIHFNVTLNSVTALRLLSGDDALRSIDPSQLRALAQLALGVQGAGLNMGFLPLGLGSAVFAYLLFRSRYIPRLVSGWGMFASLLLAVNALAIIVIPEIAALGLIPMVPMGIYEIALGFWLLIRGARIESSASHRTVQS